MGLVKAKMAFYHDAVGTRAHGEVFEVKNQQVCSQLEKAGYVQKVDGETAQIHQELQQKQQEYGQAGAQANEQVSLAHHAQNVETHKHQANVSAQRQTQESQAQQQQQQEQPESQAKAKKADK